jgi:hypothetical protein
MHCEIEFLEIHLEGFLIKLFKTYLFKRRGRASATLILMTLFCFSFISALVSSHPPFSFWHHFLPHSLSPRWAVWVAALHNVRHAPLRQHQATIIYATNQLCSVIIMLPGCLALNRPHEVTRCLYSRQMFVVLFIEEFNINLHRTYNLNNFKSQL